MSSGLFQADSPQLRTEYFELDDADFKTGNTSNGSVAATSAGAAVRLGKLKYYSKIFYLKNGTNQEVFLLAVNPNDPTRTKSLMTVLGAGDIYDFDLAAVNIALDSAAEFWMYSPSAASMTSGTKVRLFSWG